MILSRNFCSSFRAFQSSKISLTLYSKANCGLCDNAKSVMNDVLTHKGFEDRLDYRIVDIDDTKNKLWWEKYCFDIPVLHIEGADNGKLVKVFHRLDEKDVIKKIEAFF